MSEPWLRIRNHHSGACGDPPIVNGEDPNIYIGYFENPFGEQWIFAYDRITKEATLRGGDIGWNRIHAVVDGTVANFNLSEVEQVWLSACWRAAVG